MSIKAAEVPFKPPIALIFKEGKKKGILLNEYLSLFDTKPILLTLPTATDILDEFTGVQL